jgi:oligoendopeptidase F
VSKRYNHEYALQQAKAQEKISELSPELQNIAKKYVSKRYNHEYALQQAKAQKKISELSPELQNIAKGYL